MPWGTEKKFKEPTGNITQKEKKKKSFEGFSYSEIPPIANLIKWTFVKEKKKLYVALFKNI